MQLSLSAGDFLEGQVGYISKATAVRHHSDVSLSTAVSAPRRDSTRTWSGLASESGACSSAEQRRRLERDACAEARAIAEEEVATRDGLPASKGICILPTRDYARAAVGVVASLGARRELRLWQDATQRTLCPGELGPWRHPQGDVR